MAKSGKQIQNSQAKAKEQLRKAQEERLQREHGGDATAANAAENRDVELPSEAEGKEEDISKKKEALNNADTANRSKQEEKTPAGDRTPSAADTGKAATTILSMQAIPASDVEGTAQNGGAGEAGGANCDVSSELVDELNKIKGLLSSSAALEVEALLKSSIKLNNVTKDELINQAAKVIDQAKDTSDYKDFLKQYGNVILQKMQANFAEDGEISAEQLVELRSILSNAEQAFHEGKEQKDGLQYTADIDLAEKQMAKAARIKKNLSLMSKTTYEKNSLVYSKDTEYAKELNKTIFEMQKSRGKPLKIEVSGMDSMARSDRSHLVPLTADKLLVYRTKTGPFSLMLNSMHHTDCEIFLRKGCAMSPQFAIALDLVYGEVGRMYEVVEKYALEYIHSKRDFHTKDNLCIRYVPFAKYLENQEAVLSLYETYNKDSSQIADEAFSSLSISDFALIFCCVISMVFKDCITWLQVASAHIVLYFKSRYYEPIPVKQIGGLFYNFLLLRDLDAISQMVKDFSFDFQSTNNRIFVSEVPRNDLDALAAQIALKSVVRYAHSKDLGAICWAILVDNAKLSTVNQDLLDLIVKNPGYEAIKNLFQLQAYALYAPRDIERARWSLLTEEKLKRTIANLIEFLNSEQFYAMVVDLSSYGERFSVLAEKDSNGFIDMVMLSKTWNREEANQLFTVTPQGGRLYSVADCVPGTYINTNQLLNSFSYLGFKSLVDLRERLFSDLKLSGIIIDSSVSVKDNVSKLSDLTNEMELDLLGIYLARKMNKSVALALPYRIELYTEQLMKSLALKHSSVTVTGGDFGLASIGTEQKVITAQQLLVADLQQAQVDAIEFAYPVNFEGVILFGMNIGSSIKEFYTKSGMIAILDYIVHKMHGLKFLEEAKNRVVENYKIPEFFSTSRVRLTSDVLLGKRLGDIRNIRGYFHSVEYTLNTTVNLLLEIRYKANLAYMRDPMAIRSQNTALDAFKFFRDSEHQAYADAGISEKEVKFIRNLKFVDHFRSLHENDVTFIRLFSALHDLIRRRLVLIPDYEIVRKETIFEIALHNSLAMVTLFLISNEFEVLSEDVVEELADILESHGITTVTRV